MYKAGARERILSDPCLRLDAISLFLFMFAGFCAGGRKAAVAGSEEGASL